MDEHKPVTMLKNSEKSLATIPRKTMDPKFIIVLFCVEAGALVFNSLHVRAPELHLYNAYNQRPILYNISSQNYTCFTSISHCIYEHKQLRFLKVLHMSFISVIVICYFWLFTIILLKWENVRVRHDLGITWYGAIQLVVLLTLALHTLLMVILFERDHLYIYECNKQSRLVRAENLFTYVVLSMLEVAYIGFDILNRQASIHALHQDFEYRARAAEHVPPSESYNVVTLLPSRSLSLAQSYETVNQNIIPDLSEM